MSDQTPENPPPEWRYKNGFGIVQKMKDMVALSKKATESELEALRRKLERITYGG